jgi:hypothetical protein
MPTSRGSNYAIRRDLMLDLFDRGRIPVRYSRWPGGQVDRRKDRLFRREGTSCAHLWTIFQPGMEGPDLVS